MKAGSQPVQGLVRKNPISLKLGFSGDDYGYAIDLGLPLPDSSKFSSDPEIKAESLWTGERLGRANAFALRNGRSVRIRNDNGEWRQAHQHLASFDSMMTHCSDPREAIELLVVSHARALVSALDADADSRQIVLEKTLSETTVQDHVPPNWTWPWR
jgi:predicted ATPase